VELDYLPVVQVVWMGGSGGSWRGIRDNWCDCWGRSQLARSDKRRARDACTSGRPKPDCYHRSVLAWRLLDAESEPPV